MKNKGFTLVELLAVLVLISLVLVIAIPGIFKMRDKMNEKALDAKVKTIESAAIMHVQNNSNKYKSYFRYPCETKGQYCECDENNKCKYTFVINIKDLIDSGDLKPDSQDPNATCSITNPLDKKECMDCLDINITLDADYKTTTAKMDLASRNVCHEAYHDTTPR